MNRILLYVVFTLIASVFANPWDSEEPTDEPANTCGKDVVYAWQNLDANRVLVVCSGGYVEASLWLVDKETGDKKGLAMITQNLQPLYGSYDFLTGYVCNVVLREVGKDCFAEIPAKILKGLLPNHNWDLSYTEKYINDSFPGPTIYNFPGQASECFYWQGNYTIEGVGPATALVSRDMRNGLFGQCELFEGNDRLWAAAFHLPIRTFLGTMISIGIIIVAYWIFFVLSVIGIMSVDR